MRESLKAWADAVAAMSEAEFRAALVEYEHEHPGTMAKLRAWIRGDWPASEDRSVERQLRIIASVAYCGTLGPRTVDRMDAVIKAVQPLIAAEALRAAADGWHTAPGYLNTINYLRERADAIERGEVRDEG